MFALGFDRRRITAKNVKITFRERLLIQFTAFGRGCYGIVDTTVRHPCFRVVRHELIPVSRNPDTRILWHVASIFCSIRPHFTLLQLLSVRPDTGQSK